MKRKRNPCRLLQKNTWKAYINFKQAGTPFITTKTVYSLKQHYSPSNRLVGELFHAVELLLHFGAFLRGVKLCEEVLSPPVQSLMPLPSWPTAPRRASSPSLSFPGACPPTEKRDYNGDTKAPLLVYSIPLWPPQPDLEEQRWK